MAEVYLDHPNEMVWYAGHGPVPMAGPCTHDCQHNAQSVIAEGPDYEHYVLVVCDVSDGCSGRCRGWVAEYPRMAAYADKTSRRGGYGWMTRVDGQDT